MISSHTVKPLLTESPRTSQGVHQARAHPGILSEA